jgi:hypothetical protein
MTPDRLKTLNRLHTRVTDIEDALARHRAQTKMEEADPHCWPNGMASRAARQSAGKIIERDLEEQLEQAKQEFARAD